jgi:ABC-2 type transport system permease protein
MSIRNSLRTTPAMLKVAFAEAVAYRAEMFVWILSTTMPLIMLALWAAVAREAPVGRFGEKEFVVYFLVTFIVRQLTSAWAAWQMNFDIRQGTMSMRLLRPVHPLISYALENLAAAPMRMVLVVPIAIGVWVSLRPPMPTSAETWLLIPFALVGAWSISFLANTVVGCLAFFLESSVKAMDVYLALFFVFSGYLIPVELFPKGLALVANLTPFRYQIGFPVELLSGAHTFESALPLLLRQWVWVAALLGLTSLLWTRGLKRFAAYGG